MNDEGGAGGRDFALRLALFYAAFFTILGVYMPYLPVWLQWRGMTPEQIGYLTAAPLFLRVIATPLITFYADRRGDHRGTIVIGAWIGLVSASLLAFSYSFWPILVLILVFQITNQSILPLAEARALRGVRAYGLDYGQIRLWGSVSFIAANLIGGFVLARFGGGSVLALVVGAVALTALAAHAMPAGGARGGERKAGDAPSRKRIRFRDLGALAASPWFLCLMGASGAIQASHAVYYAFSAIHWRALGISDAWLGGLWGIGVLAEVALFAVSGRVMARTGAAGLILIGGVAAVVRWVAMAFDPPFGALIALQVLHALTFGATFLGALHILQSSVPEEQSGSAQGLHAAFAPGIIMGCVTVLAGQIYTPLQAYSFLVMGGLAVVGVACALALPRLLPRADEGGA